MIFISKLNGDLFLILEAKFDPDYCALIHEGECTPGAITELSLNDLDFVGWL